MSNVSASLEDELNDRFDTVTEEHGVPKARVIEDLIEIYVEKMEQEGNYHKKVREAFKDAEP